MKAVCLLVAAVLPLAGNFAQAADWPQWLGPGRDGVWRETGIMEKFPAGGPPVRWRASIGAGYAGPAVAGARVFVMDRVGAADAPKSVGVPGIGKRYDVEGRERVLWGHAYLIPHDDRFFIFNEHGDLLIARLTPAGYEEVSRAHLLDPNDTLPARPVAWSHPAFAHRSVYARSDSEIVCVSLAAKLASP